MFLKQGVSCTEEMNIHLSPILPIMYSYQNILWQSSHFETYSWVIQQITGGGEGTILCCYCTCNH